MSDCIFEAGDQVMTEYSGWGVVRSVSAKPNKLYPVEVKFHNGVVVYFGPGGEYLSGKVIPHRDLKHRGGKQ